MKRPSIASTLALSLIALGLSLAPALAQTRQAVESDAEARVIAPADDGTADDAVSMSIEGSPYICYPDDGANERPVTGCYCGDGVYLGVHCAGFPSEQVCCAVKCEELANILDGTR